MHLKAVALRGGDELSMKMPFRRQIRSTRPGGEQISQYNLMHSIMQPDIALAIKLSTSEITSPVHKQLPRYLENVH